MQQKINIEVMSTTTGKFWSLCPYNPTEGVFGAPEYSVPTYKMKLNGNSDFEVIRFGLKRTNINPPPKTRVCDTGLFNENSYTAVWLPSYGVHSGPGSVPGAWRLYHNFLIHEGSPSPGLAWGSFGCIEVVGNREWYRFLEALKRIAGTDLVTISKNKLLTVKIKHCAAPVAKLISP